jgi:hypothetical protein
MPSRGCTGPAGDYPFGLLRGVQDMEEENNLDHIPSLEAQLSKI